jgi:hypothetical protein
VFIVKQKLNHVWTRIGVLLSVSPEEMETLIHGNYDDAQQTLLKIFTEGRAEINGDSYIPFVAVDDYNNQYGTNYETDDVDMETVSFPHNKLQLEIVKEESV